MVVAAGPDAADDWIAERAGPGAIVVTSDIPLASRCVKAGAEVLGPNGRRFTENSIGMALATRNLMDHLRSIGEATSGPTAFGPRDRSNFLERARQCGDAAEARGRDDGRRLTPGARRAGPPHRDVSQSWSATLGARKGREAAMPDTGLAGRHVRLGPGAEWLVRSTSMAKPAIRSRLGWRTAPAVDPGKP